MSRWYEATARVVVAGCLLLLAEPVAAQSTDSTFQALVVADGRPVAEAKLRVATSSRVYVTDSAGRATLAVPPAGTAIFVTALGFAPESLSVTPDATSRGITIQLRRIQLLSEQAVVATKETGSERKLRQFGFLHRRNSSGAPKSAFVNEAELEKWRPSLLTDVSVRIGRDLRKCTLYIDGARMAVPPAMRGASQPYRWGVDALVRPSEILAMEVYRLAEAPIEYPVRGRDECALLIWLK